MTLYEMIIYQDHKIEVLQLALGILICIIILLILALVAMRAENKRLERRLFGFRGPPQGRKETSARERLKQMEKQ